MIIAHIIRIGVTSYFLGVAWYHAHWSVALLLTLGVIESEIVGWTLRAMTRKRR